MSSLVLNTSILSFPSFEHLLYYFCWVEECRVRLVWKFQTSRLVRLVPLTCYSAFFSRYSISLSQNQPLQCFGFFFRQANGAIVINVLELAFQSHEGVGTKNFYLSQTLGHGRYLWRVQFGPIWSCKGRRWALRVSHPCMGLFSFLSLLSTIREQVSV